MLYISGLSNDDLQFFDRLQKDFPDQILIKTEHGFDMSTSLQIVIDLSDIIKDIIPYIVPAVESVLLYRIQKTQNKIKERELELEEKKAAKSDFEIRYSTDGKSEIIIKTNNINEIFDSPEKISQFGEDLKKTLEEKQ